MLRARSVLIAGFFAAAAISRAATLGQQTIPLSNTPAPLTCTTQRYVNKLTVRVLPGSEGKVYIGSSGMDVNSLQGTVAILYPNLGAQSEEYTIQDKSGDDGIDLCSIFVAGELAGERAIAEYISNNGGTTAPTYAFVISNAGPLPANGSVANLGSDAISEIRAQILPGYSSGTTLGIPGQYGQIYFNPNLGAISDHNGWSQTFERYDPLGANGLQITFGLSGLADNSSQMLVSAWQKQAATVPQPLTTFTWSVQGFQVGSLPASWQQSQTLEAHFRKVPGRAYDSKDDILDAQGNLIGILFPNTQSRGWNEDLDLGDGTSQGLSVVSDSGAWDQVSFDFLSWTGATPPPAISSITSQMGGLVGHGSAIHRGYVKHLRVQVVPGDDGLVYLGTASMNPVTLSGVYAILYPNSIGRWSETFELDDPEGDGISTDDLYVMMEVPSEKVIVATTQSGVTPPDGVLTVKASGPLSSNFSSYAVPFAASSTPISFVRAQAIPDGYEKLWIGTNNMTAAQPDGSYANVLKILWPSQGDYDIGEGFSERFIESCHAGPASAPNCLDLTNFTYWPYYPWEQLLVFALGR